MLDAGKHGKGKEQKLKGCVGGCLGLGKLQMVITKAL